MKYTAVQKWMIRPLVLSAVLSGSSVYGAEGVLTCTHWNRDSRSNNENLVWGWLEGVQAALDLSETSTRQDQNVISRLWPDGHRVGSVVVEMDVECRPAARSNQTVQQSLKNIAYRINNRTN